MENVGQFRNNMVYRGFKTTNGITFKSDKDIISIYIYIYEHDSVFPFISTVSPYFYPSHTMSSSVFYRANRFLPRHLESAFQPPSGVPHARGN